VLFVVFDAKDTTFFHFFANLFGYFNYFAYFCSDIN